MIESDWFDIENNNTPEPDFKEARVELERLLHIFITQKG